MADANNISIPEIPDDGFELDDLDTDIENYLKNFDDSEDLGFDDDDDSSVDPIHGGFIDFEALAKEIEVDILPKDGEESKEEDPLKVNIAFEPQFMEDDDSPPGIPGLDFTPPLDLFAVDKPVVEMKSLEQAAMKIEKKKAAKAARSAESPVEEAALPKTPSKKSFFQAMNVAIYKSVSNNIYNNLSKVLYRELYKGMYRNISNALYKEIFKGVYKNLSKNLYREIYKAVYQSLNKNLTKALYKAAYKEIFKNVSRSLYEPLYKEIYKNLSQTLYKELYKKVYQNLQRSLYGGGKGK